MRVRIRRGYGLGALLRWHVDQVICAVLDERCMALTGMVFRIVLVMAMAAMVMVIMSIIIMCV